MADYSERGMDAARGYLNRAGMAVDGDVPGHMLLAATDGDERVLVAVLVLPQGGMPSAAEESAEGCRVLRAARERHPGFGRFDAVWMLVIGPDRALLRHHRDVLGGEPC